jgi:hypothetical protein
MTGPRVGERVTLSVPQREHLAVRVHATGPGFVDVTFEDSPRSSLERLERSSLFLQFVNAEGLCRIAGRLQPAEGDRHVRAYGFGAGETLRFVTSGPIQLLRRPEALRAQAAARVVLTPVGASQAPFDATTVDIGGRGLSIRGAAAIASVGALLQFDLHLGDGGAAVSGQVRVDEVHPSGIVDAHFTVLSGRDRSRLLRFAFDRSPRAA